MTLGIIPAAGTATRMDGLPKALLPTPDGVLVERLYRAMYAENTCTHCAIGTNRTTYAYLRQRPLFEHSVYKVETQTMSETVLSALPYTKDNEWCIFGMPDTYFADDEAFPKLVDALQAGADVAVGVFTARAGQHREGGMCLVEDNRVLAVIDKSDEDMHLKWIWGVLAWKTDFWNYIERSDPHIGFALPRAIAGGLDVRAVKLAGGYWDCGTPERYFELIRHLTGTKD